MKMSQQLSPLTRFSNISTPQSLYNSQSSSILAFATPNVLRPPIQIAPSVPLSSTPMASASLTGLIAPDAQVISTSSPLQVHQTVNSPIVPITPLNSTPVSSDVQGVLSQPRLMPNVTTFASVSRPASPRSTMYSIGTKTSPSVNTTLTSNEMFYNGNKISPPSSPSISRLQTTGSLLSSMSPLPPVLNNNFSSNSNLESIVSQQNLSLPTVEMDKFGMSNFEITNYQGIIKNGSIENELLEGGYGILSKVIVKDSKGNRRTQYIKAINKNGQKVFVVMDVEGYTTARATDLTLVESNRANIVPYSLKTGVYNCAAKDVCGVAFECGSDGICVLSRGTDDLTPKEANFVLVEQSAPSAATIEIEGSIMTYPVVRLSEIRANPSLVLTNTDEVTRRLRNTAYIAELKALDLERQSLAKLNASFNKFNIMRDNVAEKLRITLRELEGWNDVYKKNPPVSDEGKNKYRLLQHNLTRKNEDIATLLLVMKKVANKYADIELITEEIDAITEFANKHFENVEYVISE